MGAHLFNACISAVFQILLLLLFIVSFRIYDQIHNYWVNGNGRLKNISLVFCQMIPQKYDTAASQQVFFQYSTSEPTGIFKY